MFQDKATIVRLKNDPALDLRSDFRDKEVEAIVVLH